MSDTTIVKAKCKGCDREIDECAFCEEPDCAAAICYRCDNSELKQTLLHPHDHGG